MPQPSPHTPLRAEVILGDLASAFGLLTRLPIRASAPRGAAAAWAWPVAGAVVGAVAGLAGMAALWLGAVPGVAAALALAAGALLTGGLHEDGLSDTADGLFGGWTRERRLAIMKDSQIGSYGALALMLVTLARWSAVTALLAAGNWPALVAAGALSRAPMAVLMAALPNARGAGLSQAVGRPAPRIAALSVLLALAIALLASGAGAITAAAVAALPVLALARSAQARIGGQTGDVLGAAQQLAEVAVLAVLAR